MSKLHEIGLKIDPEALPIPFIATTADVVTYRKANSGVPRHAPPAEVPAHGQPVLESEKT